MRLKTHHARVLAADEALQDWRDLERRLVAYGRLLSSMAYGEQVAGRDDRAASYRDRLAGIETVLEFMREYPAARR